MTRWQAIVGDRGGNYWSHLRQHLSAMAFFALGFLCGVLAR
jgi:hypothetical protein